MANKLDKKGYCVLSPCIYQAACRSSLTYMPIDQTLKPVPFVDSESYGL